MMLKKWFKYLLRSLYLLQLADYFFYIRDLAKNKNANKRFIADNPGYAIPPKALAYDAYGHTNWQAYHDTGCKHATLITSLLQRHLKADDPAICEWGCGPARVIRHLSAIPGYKSISLTGVDYNEKSINWCKDNIPGIDFVQNNLEPPLPFEPSSFDCIYAISVFTHLSEPSHYAWIGEIYRVLKVNGLFIFTTHGEMSAEKLLPFQKEKLDSGRLVTELNYSEGKKHFLAYHSEAFIRHKLLKIIDKHLILEHIKDASSFDLMQEVWVIKKQKVDKENRQK